jgi:hypothetical protein
MNDEQPLDPRESALLARLQALPRTLEPERELWPAILATVHPMRSPRGLVLARAAGIVLLITAALATSGWIGYDYGKRSTAEVVTLDAGAEIGRIELAYATARESYLRQIALSGDRLDGPSRAALRSQLAIIDRAVHQLRAAMDADPHNPVYIDTLLMTREREMELLADISSITTTRL